MKRFGYLELPFALRGVAVHFGTRGALNLWEVQLTLVKDVRVWNHPKNAAHWYTNFIKLGVFFNKFTFKKLVFC